jgi:ABC-type amino acid transport system permease subunit
MGDIRILCAKWRSWLEPLVFTIYLISLVVALPICVLIFKNEETNLRTRTWFIGGIFVFLSVPVSLHTIVQHLIHYTRPNLQRHIIRILWMPLIYAASAVSCGHLPSFQINATNRLIDFAVIEQSID